MTKDFEFQSNLENSVKPVHWNEVGKSKTTNSFIFALNSI